MSKVIKKDRYLLLAIFLVLVAGGLVLVPKYEKNQGIEPTIYLKNITSPERYISTDLLAEKIVLQDPSLILIDVRSSKEFNHFSLPNAINIPMDSLFAESSLDYLDQEVFELVLYPNDHFYADQAWLMCNRLGFQHQHVLNGGLNEWFNTIISPTAPSEGMPRSEFELYNLRKATAMYFGVGTPEETIATVKKKPTKKIKLRSKKKRKAEGGC